jgi:hypothetical protein
MKFIWHREFCADYSQFPKICWDTKNDNGIKPAPMADFLGQQVKSLELWRRKYSVDMNLAVYLSHFAGFIPPPSRPEDFDFWDFQVNILQRRHQAFIENQSDEPVVLLAPGVLFSEAFDIEPYIKRAKDTNLLVIVQPEGQKIANLSGLWIVPSQIQREFCKAIPADLENRYAGADVGYWLGRAGKPIVIEDSGLTNVFPVDATPDSDYNVFGSDMVKPLTTHFFVCVALVTFIFNDCRYHSCLCRLCGERFFAMMSAVPLTVSAGRVGCMPCPAAFKIEQRIRILQIKPYL